MPKQVFDIFVITLICLDDSLILGVKFLINTNTAIASNNTNGDRLS